MAQTPPTHERYEKLGAFYLGKRYDPQGQRPSDELLLYDSKDLTTHALCVGMTGSGKTGLCVALLEEAAIDGIPAIVIDPKGDLGNLLLSFPELSPADFLPWVDERQAARKQLTPDQYAQQLAATWKAGLADWGQPPERIARFRNAVDLAIYTPGSTAGLPLAVLRSFAAPPAETMARADDLQQRIGPAVAGLLALMGIDADPIQSREHILLSNLLQRAWTGGRDLDLPTLIREIQSPPFSQIGVLGLDSFYPARDRAALATRLNNLLASPGFGVWMEGEPLDAHRLLWTASGKPRLSILSIAHLSDAQRMFFVTLLLGEVLSWMRTQPGTSCLRAILYMDEVFGYFPPTANPPSKRAMLTLLKQARAYGLGVVLATQNPVDLDYKGLANCGTWFLGRLQTQRDVARVIEGLEGACLSAGHPFVRSEIEAQLAGLKSRVFLVHNVHEDQPVLMHTRWALSYLHGPLTRVQIETLMATRKRLTTAPATGPGGSDPSAAVIGAPRRQSARPPLPPEAQERFIAPRGTVVDDDVLYRAVLLGSARVHYVRAKYDLDHWQTMSLITPLDDGAPATLWEAAVAPAGQTPQLLEHGREAAHFDILPAAALLAASYRTWRTALADCLYRKHPMRLWVCPGLKQHSRAGENESAFRARLQLTARERRDGELQKLQHQYAPKLRRLQERIRQAQARSEQQQQQVTQQTLHTGFSLGSTLLGALFGRKLASAGNVRRASSTASRAARIAREKGDVQRAEEQLQALEQQLQTLEAEFQEQTAPLQEAVRPDELPLEPVEVPPRKSDIDAVELMLVWTPWRVDPTGRARPLFEI